MLLNENLDTKLFNSNLRKKSQDLSKIRKSLNCWVLPTILIQTNLFNSKFMENYETKIASLGK